MKNPLCAILNGCLILTVSFIASCSTDVSGPGGDGINLITNASFEEKGKQSLAAWFVNDSSVVHFATDTPPQGGTWALSLGQGWVPSEGYVRTTFPIAAGRQVLQFTLWARLVGHDTIGTFSLGTIHNGVWLPSRQGGVDSDAWKLYSLIDTLTIGAGDSLAVKLSAGSAELARPTSVQFDLVRVERMK